MMTFAQCVTNTVYDVHVYNIILFLAGLDTPNGAHSSQDEMTGIFIDNLVTFIDFITKIGIVSFLVVSLLCQTHCQ